MYFKGDNNPFSEIFKPLDLKFTQLKNRLMMGSMHTGLEEDKPGLERLAAFYKERAAGGVALIVTGGIAPDRAGRLAPFSAKLTSNKEMQRFQLLTETVHEEGSKILMQILHAGRYGYHPFILAPSRLKAPINPFTPWKMSKRRILKTIDHFSRAARLAQLAGFDGIEIMGSEGYLINQFIVQHTNKRQDEWGGAWPNRMRFPVEIVRAVREAVGENFIIVYRLSMLDFIQEGSSWEEVVQLAKAIEKAGATMINTGIGWHEARIPTIASMVPNGAFCDITKRLKPEISIPLITSNRINSPELANSLIAEGVADVISMARPFLADPAFVIKAKLGESKSINVCIACNQACLDRVFANKIASCLVNPRACHEQELRYTQASLPGRIAVVGAGPAGLAFSAIAAQRGHSVTLFEKSNQIGGQFNLAKVIPGKEEYQQTIRYFRSQLDKFQVNTRLNTQPSSAELADFDKIILATGVRPRIPAIPGIDNPKVITYVDYLQGIKQAGSRVAILGAGGIGFDVAEKLVNEGSQISFYDEWGIDLSGSNRGGLKPALRQPPIRKVYLLQRKAQKMGKKLGKTTGWIHRLSLKHQAVHFLSAVQYQYIDDQGLHILHDKKEKCLEVDTIIICTGQEELRDLHEQLIEKTDKPVYLIGGAFKALELDARRAIDQACRLAAEL